MKLEADGLAVELPRGWSGRIFSREHGIATLHAASFPLVLDDGEFGDRSTARMRPGAVFLALTEYRPGAGLEPDRGLFAPGRMPSRLDPTSFTAAGLAHPRAHQVGTQRFFTVTGRPFCLYVVLAGGRAMRRGQLAAVERVLGAVRIERASAGVRG